MSLERTLKHFKIRRFRWSCLSLLCCVRVWSLWAYISMTKRDLSGLIYGKHNVQFLLSFSKCCTYLCWMNNRWREILCQTRAPDATDVKHLKSASATTILLESRCSRPTSATCCQEKWLKQFKRPVDIYRPRKSYILRFNTSSAWRNYCYNCSLGQSCSRCLCPFTCLILFSTCAFQQLEHIFCRIFESAALTLLCASLGSCRLPGRETMTGHNQVSGFRLFWLKKRKEKRNVSAAETKRND